MIDLSVILFQYNKIYSNAEESNKLYGPGHLIRISFDFKNCVFFKAELVTFIYSLTVKLRQIGFSLVDFINMNPSINKIFSRNGILANSNSLAKTDNSDTVIPLYAAYSNDSKGITSYLSNHVIKNEYWPNHLDSHSGIEIVNSAINEIVDNTYQHSGSNTISMCGQFYPRINNLGFTITDSGVGIPYNLRKHNIKNSEKMTDTDLIYWATKKGNSTKNIPESGLGLFDIRYNLKKCGSLTIVSNNGFWQMNPDGSILKLLMNNNFNGTMIHLNFFLNNISNESNNDKEKYNDNEDNIIF